MTPSRRHHCIWGAALLLALGCTDRRVAPPPLNVQLAPITQNITSSLASVAQVKFQGNDTKVLTMVQHYGSLFLTGFPFGFSRWDVSNNPENPSLTFAASDQIDTFAPNGKWVTDWYASGGLGILGRYAFLSGTAGMSVIDISETSAPREVLRKPYADPNSDQVPRDFNYVYKAIVAHPSQPIIYGFREQDYVYTLQLSNDVNIVQKDAYGQSGQLVCCVKSATTFGGRVFVAFGSRLVWFDLGQDGSLQPGGSFDKLSASNVASTDNYLYVQHNPTYGNPAGQGNPRGFYVFDANGHNVDFIASDDDPKSFQVSPADSHIYMNKDDTQIEVFRINRGGTTTVSQ